MTEIEIQIPGAPFTDPLAANTAMHALADVLDDNPFHDGDRDSAEQTAAALTWHHAVTFEHDINSNGVPVRRYVLHGRWSVDPQPPVHLPRKGDVVAFPEHLDGAIETINYGLIVPGQEWIVQAVPYANRKEGFALLQLALAAWPKGVYISESSRNVQIMRRPAAAGELTPEQHAVVADELGNARREGYREALRRARDAVAGIRSDTGDAALRIQTTAREMGVEL